MAKTPQYQAVLNQLMNLTQRLEQKANAKAKQDLVQMFQMKSWVGDITKPEVANLIHVALHRIKTDVKEYEVFIDMLDQIPVVAQFVTQMKGIIILCFIYASIF